MKALKKLIVCLMAVTLLCGSRPAAVCAAAEKEATDRSIDISVGVQYGKDVVVTFFFHYSDGNSAECTGYRATFSDKLYKVDFNGGSFSGDRATATATVTVISTQQKITLGAWCDIYGQTGSFSY